MAQKSGKRHAIIVLRDAVPDELGDTAIRGFLAKGRVQRAGRGAETLNRVLAVVGHAPVSTGMAALRFWGQTGDRSQVWLAGADPVFLETLVSGLRLHAFAADEISDREWRRLFDDLQDTLGVVDGLAFARIGNCGYLRGDASLSTADSSPDNVDGASVDAVLPANDASGRFHRLLGELQMVLHEHPVNVARENAGLRPVNSLWLWGGGFAAEKEVRPMPALFSGDPLFRGYWESCTGAVSGWNGDLADCLDAAMQDFVIAPGGSAAAGDHASVARLLRQARRCLVSGELHKLTLLFADNLQVQMKRVDLLKFWRAVPHEARGVADNA